MKEIESIGLCGVAFLMMENKNSGGGIHTHLFIYIEHIKNNKEIDNIGQRCVECGYEEYF